MAEISEKRTVIRDIPVDRRPVVESEHDHIIHERRGLSGATVAAIVLGIIIAAVLITWMIINSQQQARNDELAIERERAAAAERRASEPQPVPQQSQPQVVVVPQPQSPTTVPVPIPMPTPSQPGSTGAAPSTSTSAVSIEIDINSKLLDDSQLRTHPITAKFEDGSVTLKGEVPSEDLKTRAEKLAMTVKGVRRVINNITVRQ